MLGFVFILEKTIGSQWTNSSFREEAEEVNGSRLDKENSTNEEEKIYHQNDQLRHFSSTAHTEEAVTKGNHLLEISSNTKCCVWLLCLIY